MRGGESELGRNVGHAHARDRDPSSAALAARGERVKIKKKKKRQLSSVHSKNTFRLPLLNGATWIGFKRTFDQRHMIINTRKSRLK